jgi:hypothetical protein
MNEWIRNVSETEGEEASDSVNEWITNWSEREGENVSELVHEWITKELQKARERKLVNQGMSE